MEITVWHPFSGLTATALEDMGAEYDESGAMIGRWLRRSTSPS